MLLCCLDQCSVLFSSLFLSLFCVCIFPCLGAVGKSIAPKGKEQKRSALQNCLGVDGPRRCLPLFSFFLSLLRRRPGADGAVGQIEAPTRQRSKKKGNPPRSPFFVYATKKKEKNRHAKSAQCHKGGASLLFFQDAKRERTNAAARPPPFSSMAMAFCARATA